MNSVANYLHSLLQAHHEYGRLSSVYCVLLVLNKLNVAESLLGSR
jgi:hypothetical protein